MLQEPLCGKGGEKEQEGGGRKKNEEVGGDEMFLLHFVKVAIVSVSRTMDQNLQLSESQI